MSRDARFPNPISLVSQWKILDNLRRSLVEPATFLLLVFGWLILPGNPLYWTLATLAILFVPAWFQFLFNLVRAAVEHKPEVVREARTALLSANASVFFTLSFLPHQMLLSLDAVVRTLVRRLVTRRRLLEWETAAETEFSARKRTPVDIYLDWIPALALALGALVFFARRHAFFGALPILLLWACSKWISMWLNLPSRAMRSETSDKDELFLSRNRVTDLALFRRVQYRRAPLADPGQRAGRTCGGCGSHVADQPGFSSERATGGLRVRISDGS